MPLTVTLNRTQNIVGHQRFVRGTIDFDSSYADGGEVLNASDIGLRLIDEIVFTPNEGYYFEVRNTLPATSVNVRIICPTGGAAPTTVADPSVAVPTGTTAVTSSAVQPDLTETGGRGVELGDTADATSLDGVRFWALGV